MQRLSIVKAFLWVATVLGPAAGHADELYWYYQYAGIQTTSTSFPTAVAMGDGKAWPVVFAPTASNAIRPVTLGPFRNAANNTYWHPLGQESSFLGTVGSRTLLTARESASGEIGVFVDIDSASVGDPTTAFLGTRQAGLTSSTTNALGLVERPDGRLEPVPTGSFPTGPVRSVATTPWGSLGAVAGTRLTYHENASLLGWQSADLGIQIGSFPGHAELAYDGGGRPVIAHYLSPGGSVAATTFDTRSGDWQTVGIGAGNTNANSLFPTVASDSVGGVGVAWVSTSGSVNTLMYAYKPLGKDWNTHVVTSLVTVPLAIGGSAATDPVAPQSRVGLAFDADDLPVISFTGNSKRVYIAYDPLFPTGSVADERLEVPTDETRIDDRFVTGPIRFVKEGGGTLIRDGAATNSYGTLVAEGTLVVRNPTAISSGPLEIAAGAAVVIDSASDPSVPAIAVERLVLDPAGSLDLGHGRMTIAADGLSEADLRAAITAGRGEGGWDGSNGIGSSAAAAATPGTRAVGYTVAEDGTLTMAFSAPGDTNLDGLVNVFDLVSVTTAGRFGSAAAASWDAGDFNYDGVANVFDLLAVSTAGVFGEASYLPPGPAAAADAGAVAVPEPHLPAVVAAMSFGVFAAAMLRRPRLVADSGL